MTKKTESTSEQSETELLKIASHAKKLKEQGLERQTISFDVNPYIFSLLRDFGQTHGKSPSQAAYRIIVAWLQEVVDAAEKEDKPKSGLFAPTADGKGKLISEM